MPLFGVPLSIPSLSSVSFAFSLSLVSVFSFLFLQGSVSGPLSLPQFSPRLSLGSCHLLNLPLWLWLALSLLFLWGGQGQGEGMTR